MGVGLLVLLLPLSGGWVVKSPRAFSAVLYGSCISLRPWTAKGPNLTLAETWPQGPRTSQADQTESRLYYLGLIKHARQLRPL